MHEAGLIAAAVATALAAAPAAGARPSAVRLTVLDPVHLSADAARLHAELALRSRDLGDVPLEVTAVPVTCAGCGAVNRPEPSDPFCASCGWPLPRPEGPEVDVEAAW